MQITSLMIVIEPVYYPIIIFLNIGPLLADSSKEIPTLCS